MLLSTRRRRRSSGDGSPGGRPRGWRSLCAALRDPARSDFAFVPHQYVRAPAEELEALSEGESTPVHARKPLPAAWGSSAPAGPSSSSSASASASPPSQLASGLFARCVAAAGVAGVSRVWAALFPLSPARLYDLQVDVFGGRHAHAAFFLGPGLLLGQVLGAALAGALGDRLGRVGALELAAAPLLLGWAAVGAAPGELSAVLGRYLLGAGAGMAAVLAPVFLAEVSAAGARGRVLALQAAAGPLGALAYVAGGALLLEGRRRALVLGPGDWRPLALAGLLPALLLLALAQRLPDSPVFLVARHGDRAAALDVCLRLAGGDRARAERRANAVVHARELAARQGPGRAALYRPLLLCGALAALRAVALALARPTLRPTPAGGVVLSALGVPLDAEGGDAQQLRALGAAWAAALLGLAAGALLVDAAGRRRTLRVGCYVSALACAALLAAADETRALRLARPSDGASAAALLLLLGLHLGLGVVPVVLASELFPARHRLGAVALVAIADAAVQLAVGTLAPRMADALRPADAFAASVAAVGACSLAALIASWLYVPETRGRSLQEIEAVLAGWRPATPTRRGSRVWLTYGSMD